ncbi:cytochrome P450 [Actinoalloteichus sp. AHMU CJ021]|uniref:Pentalenic acid synthase n=1 Tax=Actinoalloteichus caeruleus DSM 43889 TaxID=1120930 RepID=A0ABT1JG93_ACTCY|nr:cytochrome P450 [Actinoalloteichus caeruleus]AUS81271.1 cytochrome P450 [Actinoalloteichus sp. AHMU CJ021]MCP2330791.1 pentalenic acid synthase [Actinoalloteichus caeruleus DSM 43889]
MAQPMDGSPRATTEDLPHYPRPRECPYRPSPALADLRGPRPLSRVRLYDGRTAWLVTGVEEARALLADPRLSSRADLPGHPVLHESHLHMRATREMAREEDGGFAGVLFGVDPPDHTRQRRMLLPSFTLRRVQAHRDEIQRIVDEVLDGMVERGSSADLVDAFARPVPMMVVCSFLGVPYQERDRFEGPASTLFDPARAEAAEAELTSYLEDLVRRKAARETAEVGGTPGLLDRVIDDHLRTGELTVDELVAFALAILVAGTVTSTQTLALGTLALLDNPGQYALLASSPELVPGAVDEMMRHLSLVEQLARVALADIEIAGTLIREGEGILIGFAAMHFGPDLSSHPDEFDIERPPVGHFAFSHGIHHCMGHNLARLELEIAFRTLTGRLPGLRLAVPAEQVPWYDDLTLARLRALPVSW